MIEVYTMYWSGGHKLRQYPRLPRKLKKTYRSQGLHPQRKNFGIADGKFCDDRYSNCQLCGLQLNFDMMCKNCK